MEASTRSSCRVAAVALAWWLIAGASTVGGPGAALGGIFKGSALKSFFTKIGSTLWSKGASLLSSFQQYGAPVLNFLATNVGKVVSVVWHYKEVIGAGILLNKLGESIVDVISEIPHVFPTSSANAPAENEGIKEEATQEQATETQQQASASQQEEVEEENVQARQQEEGINQQQESSKLEEVQEESQQAEQQESTTPEDDSQQTQEELYQEIYQLEAQIKALEEELSKRLESILQQIRQQVENVNQGADNSSQANDASEVNPNDISGKKQALENAVTKAFEAIIGKDDPPVFDKDGNLTYSPRCNKGVNKVYKELTGNKDLAGKRANEMIKHMSESPHWKKIDTMEEAHKLANEGYMVVAGWKNPIPNKSGHVAVVVPGKMVKSKKWGREVPMTMDTGVRARQAAGSLSNGFAPDKRQTIEFYVYKGPINKK